MRLGFWKADGLLGLAFVLLFAPLHRLTDLLLTSASRAPSRKVAIIAIDKQRIAQPENERIDRALGTEVAEGLVRFLERALAQNPDERFQAAKVDLEI